MDQDFSEKLCLNKATLLSNSFFLKVFKEFFLHFVHFSRFSWLLSHVRGSEGFQDTLEKEIKMAITLNKNKALEQQSQDLLHYNIFSFFRLSSK